MRTNVPIGPSTIGGWLSALGALLAGIGVDIDQNRELFTGPGSLLTKLAAGILVATHAGRQYQAAHLPGSEQVGDALDVLPAALQGVPVTQAPPEPDVVDGPHVEFSGAEPPAQG